MSRVFTNFYNFSLVRCFYNAVADQLRLEDSQLTQTPAMVFTDHVWICVLHNLIRRHKSLAEVFPRSYINSHPKILSSVSQNPVPIFILLAPRLLIFIKGYYMCIRRSTTVRFTGLVLEIYVRTVPFGTFRDTDLLSYRYGDNGRDC